jgi:hypothetical protein
MPNHIGHSLRPAHHSNPPGGTGSACSPRYFGGAPASGQKGSPARQMRRQCAGQPHRAPEAPHQPESPIAWPERVLGGHHGGLGMGPRNHRVVRRRGVRLSAAAAHAACARGMKERRARPLTVPSRTALHAPRAPSSRGSRPHGQNHRHRPPGNASAALKHATACSAGTKPCAPMQRTGLGATRLPSRLGLLMLLASAGTRRPRLGAPRRRSPRPGSQDRFWAVQCDRSRREPRALYFSASSDKRRQSQRVSMQTCVAPIRELQMGARWEPLPRAISPAGFR